MRTGRIRFSGHESVSARMTEEIMRRLRFSNEEIEATVEMVQNHMVFKDVQNMRVARLKRFMARPTFDDELELHRVDCLGSHGLLDNYEFLRRRREEFASEPLIPPPLLTGHDLIALGWKPGPNFKAVLDAAQVRQLEGTLRTREEALSWVTKEYPNSLSGLEANPGNSALDSGKYLRGSGHSSDTPNGGPAANSSFNWREIPDIRTSLAAQQTLACYNVLVNLIENVSVFRLHPYLPRTRERLDRLAVFLDRQENRRRRHWHRARPFRHRSHAGQSDRLFRAGCYQRVRDASPRPRAAAMGRAPRDARYGRRPHLVHHAGMEGESCCPSAKVCGFCANEDDDLRPDDAA